MIPSSPPTTWTSRPVTSSSDSSFLSDTERDDGLSTYFHIPPTPEHSVTISGNSEQDIDLTHTASAHLPRLSLHHPDMPMQQPTSANSSPTDFAFEVPSTLDLGPFTGKDLLSHHQYQHPQPGHSMNHPYGNGAFDMSSSGSTNPGFGYSSASSFSSMGSSMPGSSFSSQDALPAISRDFARPQPSETRRPATASGALHGAVPGQRFQKIAEERPETIDENGGGGGGDGNMFSNPFASPVSREDKQVPSHLHAHSSEVDPRFNPANRRASEGHFAMQPPQWTNMGPPMASPSTMTPPTNMSQFDLLQQLHAQHRSSSNLSARPQTSDGLPKFSSLNGVSLPSAKTIAGQAGGFHQISNTNSAYIGGSVPVIPGQVRSSLDSGKATMANSSADPMLPYRDSRSASLSELSNPRHMSLNGRPVYAPSSNSDIKQSSELTFVPLGGPAPKKRPRRRYDEIERLYLCGFQGCEKSYGTLNHLNAHVAMQKHGEKRLPAEFKEMRKSWRKKKREMAAAAANGQFSGGGSSSWNRASGSSSSDYDQRRDSTSSAMSSASELYGYPTSSYGWDSRPNTASSTASSIDPRAPFSSSSGAAVYNPYGSSALGGGMPPSALSGAVDPNSIRRGSAPQHIPMPPMSSGLDGGFRPTEGDHPTPTPQNPFIGGGGGQGQVRPGSSASFPFQALTQPISSLAVGPGQLYGSNQFAFQR